jgi:hypothetical protein
MAYDAITIDTNIFTMNGYRLEDGRLGLLRQFSDGPVKFVLSEIMRREVEKHLIAKAKEAADGLEKSIKSVEQASLLSQADIKDIHRIHDNTRDYETVVRLRINAFLDATRAQIVEAGQADMAALTARYFSATAPFENVGKKKNEFPDAIALLSLERWAAANGKKILAVSEDAGWAAFAKDCERIDLEADFDKALETVQQHVHRAKALVGSLLADLDAGKAPAFRDEIMGEIGEAVSLLMVEEELVSIMEAELTSSNVDFQGCSFVEKGDAYSFDIVEIGDGRIVASVDLRISAVVTAEFALSVWHSIDHEYVSMGNVEISQEIEFERPALMTFVGEFDAKHLEVKLTRLELIDQFLEVDFGEVGPDDDFYEE